MVLMRIPAVVGEDEVWRDRPLQFFKTVFEELKRAVSPDLIFTHNRRDAHQDHRLISELTWNTFRNHLILEYEIPKYDGDMGQPSVFLPISVEMCEKKVRLIMDTFRSQCD